MIMQMRKRERFPSLPLRASAPDVARACSSLLRFCLHASRRLRARVARPCVLIIDAMPPGARCRFWRARCQIVAAVTFDGKRGSFAPRRAGESADARRGLRQDAGKIAAPMPRHGCPCFITARQMPPPRFLSPRLYIEGAGLVLAFSRYLKLAARTGYITEALLPP